MIKTRALFSYKKRDFLKRFKTLKAERAKYEPLWKKALSVFLPSCGSFSDSNLNPVDNLKRYQNLFNSTGVLAVERLASGMQSGLTSPTRSWFRLEVENPELRDSEEVQEWMWRCDNFLRSVFLKSNVYRTLDQCYKESAVVGSFAFMVEEDSERVIKCIPFTIGEYYVTSLNGYNIDTIYRRFFMSVGQLVEKFGIESVSNTVKEHFRNDRFDLEIPIIHVVEPNKFYDEDNPFDKKFISVYFEDRAGVYEGYLSFKGYKRCPVICPRWDVIAGSNYGNAASYRALSDALMLQVLQEEKIKAVQLTNDPPKEAPMHMGREETLLTPGATFYTTGTSGSGVKTIYQPNIDFNKLELLINQTEDRIKSAFYNDLFLMVGSKKTAMTAAEVGERAEEKYIMLSSVIDRLGAELLQPLISITLEIAAEGGYLLPPPKELDGEEYKIEYISFLAQAQKMLSSQGISLFVQFVSSLASLNPEAIDRIDTDQMVDEFSEAVGTPPSLIRSEEQVKKIRSERELRRQVSEP